MIWPADVSEDPRCTSLVALSRSPVEAGLLLKKMFGIDQFSDERLVKLADRWLHWIVYCNGLGPISAYSLREALIEGRRTESTDHILQHIRLASGEVTIQRGQTARLWALLCK